MRFVVFHHQRTWLVFSTCLCELTPETNVHFILLNWGSVLEIVQCCGWFCEVFIQCELWSASSTSAIFLNIMAWRGWPEYSSRNWVSFVRVGRLYTKPCFQSGERRTIRTLLSWRMNSTQIPTSFLRSFMAVSNCSFRFSRDRTVSAFSFRMSRSRLISSLRMLSSTIRSCNSSTESKPFLPSWDCCCFCFVLFFVFF